MHWEDEYRKHGALWGEGPSELALAATNHLKKTKSRTENLTILDIGCGYGRDAFYYAANLKCHVLGIDVSEKAVEIASSKAAGDPRLKFRHCSFTELNEAAYDIVSVSNLYQILRSNERGELRDAIARSLGAGGLLFLSTLSVSDPEHIGKGSPVPGEPNSFQDKVYLHLCTRDELQQDFAFVDIKELYEQEYYEPRATGETHHHVSWILIGEARKSNVKNPTSKVQRSRGVSEGKK